MSLRESVRLRVLANIGETEGNGILDQRAEHAATARKAPDRGTRLLVYTSGQEARKLRSGVVQHAKGGIAGVGELLGRLQHALQNELQVELA